MKVCHPVRLLLPISATALVIPFLFPDKLNEYVWVPICYFFGTYFFFINFPRFGEIMHEKPIWLEDLILATGGQGSHSFRNIYSNIMNAVLALLFALFAEYVITQGIRHLPVVEIMGIVGGNLVLYVKIQHTVGKMLISVCHCMKEKHEERLSDSVDSVEVSTIVETNIDSVFGFDPEDDK